MRSRATAFGAPTSRVCSIPSDQPGRPQPGLQIGPADVAPSRQLGQGRRPDLPVGEPDLLDGEERRQRPRRSEVVSRRGADGHAARWLRPRRSRIARLGKPVPLPAQQDLSHAARRHERAPRLDRVPDGCLQPAPAGARDIVPLLMRRRGHRFEAGGEIAQQLALGRGGGAVVGALEGAQRGGLARPIRRRPRSRAAGCPGSCRSSASPPAGDASSFRRAGYRLRSRLFHLSLLSKIGDTSCCSVQHRFAQLR